VAELKDGILTLTFKLQLPEEKKPKSRRSDPEELTPSSNDLRSG